MKKSNAAKLAVTYEKHEARKAKSHSRRERKLAEKQAPAWKVAR